MCRFPAFETGSVDRTAGACRRGPAEPELPPANGGVPLILAMACGYPGTGNAADRPSTAGPADNRPNRDPRVVIAYAAWGFVHFAYCWAVSGRTAGIALSGVRVVTDDSTGASGRRAVARTLAVPLSFLFPGLGFAGILLGTGAGPCMT